MSGMVEVHEKILAQLQQRNVQLQQEKAELALRLRQATALLSELQSVWMDLPPKLADSITKVLSNRPVDAAPMGSPRSSFGEVTPKRQTTGGQKTPLGSPRSEEPDDGPKKEASPKKPSWFSFDMNNMFGCTTPRASEPVDLNDRVIPPQPEQRPVPYIKNLPVVKEMPGGDNIVEHDESPASEAEPEPTYNSNVAEAYEYTPRSVSLVDMDRIGDHRDQVVMALDPVVRLDDQLPGDESATCAEDMVDLLTEVPGATAVIAEIDVLCCALQKEAQRSHKHLEQRIETLKSETREHRQRLEEAYLRSTAAQQEELQMCKAKVAEVIAEYMPSNHFDGEIEVEECDAEWARCQRIGEQRARAGQAHVDWLEECFSQRLAVTEALRDARKREFHHDIEAIWSRKAMLTARFRHRFQGCEVDKQELASLRRGLDSLERNALVPLQTLSEMQRRDEQDEATRLKAAVGDARAQCKAATSLLSGFLEESKLDAADMRSSQNAALFAHSHLQKRVVVIVYFRHWREEFFKLKFQAGQRELAKIGEEVSAHAATSQELERKNASVTARLVKLESSRISAVDFVHMHLSQTASLSVAFVVWVSVWSEARLTSTRKELSSSTDEATTLSEKLTVAEAARAKGEKQLQRAQGLWTADMLWLQNEQSRKMSILVAVFMAWHLKRLETQMQALATDLEAKTAHCTELSCRVEPLETAVHFSQRRAGRRAVLATVYCSWVTQYLQQLAHQAAQREARTQKQTGRRLEQLRDTVMRLVDDYEKTDIAESLTPTPRRRTAPSTPSCSRISESPPLSEDESIGALV